MREVGVFYLQKNHKTKNMELFSSINQVKSLLDKVLLQTLQLVEDDLTLKISIEKLTNEGALNLAKTRYFEKTHLKISKLS